MNRIMICGSRDASEPMIAYAKRCVQRAADRGDIILVGDADGVDRAVVEACEALDVPCVCAGIATKPRNGGAKNVRSTYLNVNMTRDSNGNRKPRSAEHRFDYTQRDEHLAKSAGIVIGIWNGSSNGTRHVIDFAAQSSFKRVYEVTFDEHDQPCVKEVTEYRNVFPAPTFQSLQKV